MLLTGCVNSLEVPYYEPLEGSTNRRMRRSAVSAVLHSGISTKKIRVYGELARYLIASSDSIIVGPHDANDPQACFRIHRFQVMSPSPEGGSVVIIQTQDELYIAKDPENSEAVKLRRGTRPQDTEALDDRFFRIYQNPGDAFAHLQHIQSGSHLSANQSGVSLLSSSGDLPESTFFQEYDCTHT